MPFPQPKSRTVDAFSVSHSRPLSKPGFPVVFVLGNAAASSEKMLFHASMNFSYLLKKSPQIVNRSDFHSNPRAIQCAESGAKLAPQGDFRFVCGSLEALQRVETGSADAVVLSNIIDNLYPEDAAAVLTEIKRILKKNGRILLKLNPYLTAEQIKAWNIRVISGNLLDDGMILWNQTTEEWNDFLSARFQIVHYEDIYYEEHNQYNRMYLLVNP